MNTSQQRAYYRSQHIKRLSLYNHCHIAAKRALRLQLKPVLEAVRRGESTESALHHLRAEPIQQGLLSIYTKVVPPFALLSYRKLLPTKADVAEWQQKKDFLSSFLESEWIARARYYVNTVAADRIRRITETTRTKVRQFLDDAVAEGWSVTRTATELTSYTQALNKSRAVVIARTELISASSYGSLQGAKSTRLKLDKVWLSTKDSRTRHSHQSVNGQKRDIDQPFSINGYQLNHPGDTTLGAAASEVVQCRCTIFYQPKSQLQP